MIAHALAWLVWSACHPVLTLGCTLSKAGSLLYRAGVWLQYGPGGVWVVCMAPTGSALSTLIARAYVEARASEAPSSDDATDEDTIETRRLDVGLAAPTETVQ